VYFNIYRVSGGRIRENWAEYDRMSMAEQLGFQVTPPRQERLSAIEACVHGADRRQS
jgi:hypothetical protein